MTQTRFVEPRTVASHFHIHEGETVADFGAGTGYFIPLLSEAVGKKGVVFACEIQKNLIETLAATAREKSLDNVRVLWGDLEAPGGSKVPDKAVDMGLLVNVLFQLEDKQTAVAEILRTMRSGARLYIIDWSESFGGLGPQPSDVVTEGAARALFESAGCTYERSFEAGGHHYGIMFRTP